MADIELAIKIPEELLSKIDDENYQSVIYWYNTTLYCAIKDGTPLPKGHGKLIAEPTEEEIAKTIGGQNDFAECIRDSVKAVFDNAPTIIEADKESENEI